jgi:cytochrome c oxidase subunit 2
MRMDAVALDAAGFETWKANQLEKYTSPAAGSPEAANESTFMSQCSRCHQVNGISNADGVPVIARPDLYVWSGAAPNLTNLMTRTNFAGGSFDLITDDCRDRLYTADAAEFSALYLEGVTPECLNAVNLRGWLRNPPGMKPMYTATDDLEPTDGKTRGMPNLNLSEDQIDQIVDFLTERK